MVQAMMPIKQHAIVEKLHADMETTTHDMRNVRADATNKLETVHKSRCMSAYIYWNIMMLNLVRF